MPGPNPHLTSKTWTPGPKHGPDMTFRSHQSPRQPNLHPEARVTGEVPFSPAPQQPTQPGTQAQTNVVANVTPTHAQQVPAQPNAQTSANVAGNPPPSQAQHNSDTGDDDSSSSHDRVADPAEADNVNGTSTNLDQNPSTSRSPTEEPEITTSSGDDQDGDDQPPPVKRRCTDPEQVTSNTQRPSIPRVFVSGPLTDRVIAMDTSNGQSSNVTTEPTNVDENEHEAPQQDRKLRSQSVPLCAGREASDKTGVFATCISGTSGQKRER